LAALIAAQGAGHRIPHAGELPGAGVSQVLVLQVEACGARVTGARRDRLKAEVARLLAEHEGKYGSPRITADLRERGGGPSPT